MAITYFNTIPTNNATFLTDLQTFLQEEDAERFHQIFGGEGIVISGGLHGTGGSLTGAPGATVAYAGGYRILESGSITYADDSTTWVVMHKDTSGLPATPGNFTRVAGTHYLIDSATGASQPALPEDSTFCMKVTTASGSITAVVDHRITALNAAGIITSLGDIIIGDVGGVPTRLAVGSTGGILVVGAGTLSYLGIGSTGDILHVASGTPAWASGWTTKGDLIAGGASGAPTRLPVGANGNVVVAASGETTGLESVAGLTTTGDLWYINGSSIHARLPIGTAGQVLTVSGSQPAWGAASLSQGGTSTGTYTTLQLIRTDVTNSKMESAGVTVPAGGTGNIVTENNTQTLTNKTLTTPTVASLTNMQHDHLDAAGGGTLSLPQSGLATATGGITGTSAATGADTIDVVLNSHSFFPMIHSSVPTDIDIRPHGTDGSSADSPRFRLEENAATANAYDVDWRYITA